MPSLSKKVSTGAFFVQFYDSDRDPKQKRVYLKDDQGEPITRQREARRAYRALTDEIEAGRFCPWRGDIEGTTLRSDRPDAPTPVVQAVEQFVHYKSLTTKPETADTYGYVLRPFAEVVSGAFVHEIDAMTVIEYVAGKDLAPSTRKSHADRICIFLRWAQSEGMIREDVTRSVRVGKVPARSLLDRFIKPDEFRRWTTFVEREGDPSHGWIVPVAEFGINTGLRLSELTSTTFENVDLKGGSVVVPAERAKNSQERRVPLNAMAYQAVVTERERLIDRGTFRPDLPVFQDRRGPLSRDHVSKTFKRYVREATFMPDRYHFHCLRHSFCSLLAQQGVPAVTIRDLAGHASISTSERYIHAFYRANADRATAALNSIWS